MATRRKLAVAAVGLAGVIGMTAMPAQAHPLEFTRGAIQRNGLAPLVCEGPVKILQPTTQCAIYKPKNETYHNPYTEDGESPGILGFGSMFGLL
jgi:hypothetical protein